MARLTVRVPDALLQAVQAAATQGGVSVSDVLRQALAQSCARQTHRPHTPQDCFDTLLRVCSPAVETRVREAAAHWECRPDEILTAVLYGWATGGGDPPYWQGLHEALQRFFKARRDDVQ